MNILDTFLILFKSDTTDLEKGQKRAEKSSQDLNDRIKKTNEDTQDLSVSFLDLAQKAAAALGVVVGVGAAISSVFGSEKQALNVGFFAQNTGYAAGQVDALAQATIRYGGSLESTMATLDKINQGTTFLTPFAGAGDRTFMPTQFAITAATYGIHVENGDTPEKIFDQLHRQFRKRIELLGEKQGRAVNLKESRALGIDDASTRMLEDKEEVYNRIKKDVAEIGLLTDENTRAAEEFYMKWGDISQIIREFNLFIGTKILDFFNALPDLINNNKQAFDALAATLKIVAGVIGFLLIPSILELIVLGAPILFLAFAFGLLYLTIYKFGNPETWGWVKTLSAWIDNLTTGIGRLIASLYALSHGDFKMLGQVALGDPNEASAAAKKLKYDVISGTWGTGDDRVQLKDLIKVPDIGGMLSRAAGGNSATSSVHIGSIEVHTQATDADGVASAIGDHLEKHMNTAMNNFATSVQA